MTETPAVSVIMATRNPGEWFGPCITSVLNQSFADLELIIVDDGSDTPVGTAMIPQQWHSDPRLRIDRIPPSGVSAARNRGVELSRGHWIAFADDDDLWHPEAISLLTRMAETTGAEAAVGRMLYSELPAFRPVGTRRVALMSGPQAVLHALHQTAGFDNGVWAKLFCRNLFSKDVTFRPGRYEDLDIIYRLYERASRVVATRDIVYFYRRRPGSFINTFSPARLDVLDVTDRIKAHYAGASRALRGAAADRAFGAACNILMAIGAAGATMPEAERRCITIIRSNRGSVALNPRVRLKNKLGSILALLWPGIFKTIGHLNRKS